jgi:hypothetical protein
MSMAHREFLFALKSLFLLHRYVSYKALHRREDSALTSDSGNCARAQLIRTRRGTWIDESLLPEARQECLEILRAASDAVGEDVIKMARGDRRHLDEDSLPSDYYSCRGHRALVRDGLVTLHEETLKYRLREEAEAWRIAYDAHETAETCGCCGFELSACEPAYFGAEVYVGMWPLLWDYIKKPQICKARYLRTVLCGSCAPEWLSAERDDVVTQLCAHCERAMVSHLELSELQNVFCSARCQEAYYNQLRKDKRAEDLEKVRKKRAEERKKVCEVCDKKFTATRRDAKTCSDGCKQKAYRRRKKEVQENR